MLFLRTFIVLSKAKGDEDVGVKVRVRVQKSKVCQKKSQVFALYHARHVIQ
jgi:hypothetical protein